MTDKRVIIKPTTSKKVNTPKQATEPKMDSVLNVTGFEDVIYIPKEKGKKNVIPDIQYTTEFDQTLNLDSNTTIIQSVHGMYSRYVDSGLEFSNLKDLINNYRAIEYYPDVAKAIQHIIMEIFPVDISDKYVSINFKDSSTIPENIRKKTFEEFDYLYNLVDEAIGVELLFHSWYVDGRCAVYKIIDTKNPKNGIINVSQLDPLNLFPIAVVETIQAGQLQKIKVTGEYFVYKPTTNISKNISYGRYMSSNQLRLDKNLVAYQASGLRDDIVGYLHPCVKPVNIMVQLEDSAAIYRIARAPERRIFYVGVGDLPPKAADEYVKRVIKENATQMSFDTETGSIKSKKRNVLSVLDDIYLPRRDNGRGTEVSTLPSGANLDQIADIEMFRRNVRQATNVPLSRFDDQSSPSMLGFAARALEASKDEMVFGKFTKKLKKQFFKLFLDLLKTQLIFKNIVKENEADDFMSDIELIFPISNMMERQIMLNNIEQQANIMSTLDNFVGKYWSMDDVHRQIFGRTDEEIKKFNIDLMNSAATAMPTGQDMTGMDGMEMGDSGIDLSNDAETSDTDTANDSEEPNDTTTNKE